MQRTLAASFSLILSGCASMPDKPVVEIGQIDLPKAQVWIGLSDGTNSESQVPLNDYDKATCFKPGAWADEKTYILLLERYASQCQKAQAVK